MNFDSKNIELNQAGHGNAMSADASVAQPVEDLAAELPDYLVRYYRWAYLWPAAVWLFDHQPIINAILFGNYRGIMEQTLRMLEPDKAGSTLQIAAVYGELTPRLAGRIDDLHVIDIAPVQLKATAKKLDAIGANAQLARMNAERLTYDGDSFDTALIFLLLHELPPEARVNTLREALRVIRPGGKLVVAEYGEIKQQHFIHRFAPLRWTLTTAEYFLDSFWKQNLDEIVEGCAFDEGKSVEVEEQVDIFNGFYRVVSYRLQ